MELNNFQRIGSISNAHAGKVFEEEAKAFFSTQGISLSPAFSIPVGIHKTKKLHKFDLGSETPKILVECKSHAWTQGSNTPSAKLTVWNEAMYYFHAAPAQYRKILFVLKDHHKKKSLTLAAYYLQTYLHLIPESVEIWEYDSSSKNAFRIHF